MTRPVALITGVGRTAGIGTGIARCLVADGWDLVLSQWTPADEEIFGESAAAGMDDVGDELRQRGARVIRVPADLEQVDAPARLIAQARKEFGTIDALVLSHAWDIESGVLDTTVEEFDKHFAINARASWMLIAEFARQVETGGAIVALTSDHTAGNLPYGVSKGALDRLVIAAAKELAPRGISANVVNPGPIDTGWMSDEVRATLIGMQPSGRLGTATDTGNLVAFLLSPKGRWVTGQLLMSDGGFSVSI
jgi:3-oxoacyl-[acyl-carrier protein] reductase